LCIPLKGRSQPCSLPSPAPFNPAISGDLQRPAFQLPRGLEKIRVGHRAIAPSSRTINIHVLPFFPAGATEVHKYKGGSEETGSGLEVWIWSPRVRIKKSPRFALRVSSGRPGGPLGENLEMSGHGLLVRPGIRAAPMRCGARAGAGNRGTARKSGRLRPCFGAIPAQIEAEKISPAVNSARKAVEIKANRYGVHRYVPSGGTKHNQRFTGFSRGWVSCLPVTTFPLPPERRPCSGVIRTGPSGPPARAWRTLRESGT